MNKYQRLLSKFAKKDMKNFPISYYSAKKFNYKLFNGFKGVSVEKGYIALHAKKEE